LSNTLIVLSGPSGVGKGTIVKRLLEKGGFELSVSCTTRAPRAGEKDGVSYFFIPRDRFTQLIREGGFLEYSEHFGNYYGTPKFFVESKLKTRDVILEIDVDGALAVKKAYPAALLIMIAPPDREELKKRLLLRGTETAEGIEQRLSRLDYELSKQSGYDYVVINGNLDKAVKEIENIIENEKQNR